MSQRSVLRAAGSAILALSLTAATVRDLSAQVFAGAGAGVSMPEAPPVAPKPPLEILRPMPSTLEGLRLTGESGEIVWPVYASAGQVAGARRFRVGYLSAISVLPEVSKLTVRINDREIGTEVIDASHGLRTVEFTIPTGLMQPGYNAIRLSILQRHRVDCSVAATYELWTRVDPGETGIVLAAEARAVASVSDLPGLLLKDDGSLPIHVVLPGKTSPQHLQRLIAATSAIALAAHAVQPVVDFDPTVADISGVDLAVATRAVLAKNPRFAAVIGNSGPLVTILPSDAFRRPTLLVVGTTEAELDQAIGLIASDHSPKGPDAGRIAARAFPGFATQGGESLVLRDLGLKSQEFSGRFFRKSFNLDLPGDFLASDYGRGTFDLAGGYAAGLTRDAQVRLDVNGKSSGVIKLPYARGDVFRHNQLFLPLGLMRPGLNRIDIYAETPRPGDASCEAADAKRFLFSDLSKIELPSLARVQRLPDLAVTMAGALPYARGASRLIVPKPDRMTMGSALSIAARASVAAGKVIPFEFATRMPEGAGGSTLIVAPARALDPSVMRDAGLDPREVEAAWRDIATASLPSSRTQGRWWLADNDGPAACHMPSLANGVAPPSPTMSGPAFAVTSLTGAAMPKPDNEDLLESWSEERHPRRNWLATLESFGGRIRDWADVVPKAVRARFAGKPQTNGIAREASLVLAQGMSRGSKDAVTTIVTAPNSEILRASVPCLFDPQVWSKVHGRLAVLDATRGAVTSTDATQFHYVGGPRMSLANTRLVIAGWFSLEPFAFVAVAMLLALSLSGTTLWFVRGIGRRSER